MMTRRPGRRPLGRRLFAARAHAGDPDAAPLRRVGWRLAALTVGLLCALLLVLGLSIYLATQQVLLDSLKHTVSKHVDPLIVTAASPGPGPGPRSVRDGGLGLGGARPPARLPVLDRSGRRDFAGRDFGDGVFTTVADGRLTVLYDIPFLHAPLPDLDAARAALAGRLSTPWSVQQVDERGPYLIYTARGRVRRTGGVVTGVVQARISERQYIDSTHYLLGILLAVSAAGLLASALISLVLAGRALQPIRAALRRQRDFVADAAHELRTPLAIMRGASELGLTAGIGPEQEASLEQVLAQNAHLTRLVEDLSTLARADSGAVDVERAPVDLSRLVVETVEGVAVLAEDRGVRLAVEATGGVRVSGDAGRLRQVLLILLDNALKHTPAGGAVAVCVAREGGQARLQVRDSGPGIAPEDVLHVFDRFYRANRARTSGEGTGLGLAIGRWIAEAHGGHIVAANAPAPERGALFTVTLPLVSP